MADRPKYYNEARNRASQKYNAAHLEEVRFRVKKGERALLQEEAEKHGQSLTQYLIQAVNERAGTRILTPSNPVASKGQEESENHDK